MTISIVILAAGAAKRMGCSKQLLPLGGKPIIWQTTATACSAGLGEVIVVTGAKADLVSAAVADLPVRIVYNSYWETGQASSVRTGLSQVDPAAAGVIFLPADQPLVTSTLLQELAALYQSSGATAAAPCRQGRRSSPALFDLGRWRQQLLNLQGDQGGRSLLDAAPGEVVLLEVADDCILCDADSPSDYENLQQLWADRRIAFAGNKSNKERDAGALSQNL